MNRGRLWSAWIPLCMGCALTSTSPSLPSQSSVVRDQLVVHSDFELPRRHRLIEELTALRIDMGMKLDLPVSDEPIHVYLFDDVDTYQRYMKSQFPDFPERRAFFVESDTLLSIYAFWGDRVAEDLRHELTHGYLHSVTPNVPLWLDEGIAEFYETPRGLQGLNEAHFEMLRNRSRNGIWQPDLLHLESVSSVAEMTQQEYAEAWLWVHFLLDTSPGRSGMVQSYLAELRRTATAPPFSQILTASDHELEATLLQHLESVAGSR
ncbi:MAG: DUF1570 domain-containing protein [Pirellulaceae bacterium]